MSSFAVIDMETTWGDAVIYGYILILPYTI